MPRVGTWIEIIPRLPCLAAYSVVPRVGTWIEILEPMGVRALNNVVPRVGTWIEIELFLAARRDPAGRASRRHVD